MQRKSIRSIAIAGLAAAGLVGIAGPAFADGPQSGTVSGTVQVGEALTLQLVNTSFTVSNALPGVTDNGVPPIGVTISENDSAGFTMTTFMNDPTTPTPYPACSSVAFTGAGSSIPDAAWTVVSSGGPGAAGTAQAFPNQPSLGGGNSDCINARPLPVTIGQSGGVGNFNYTEQLAVTVPGTTPSGTYTGALTIAVVGS